MISASVGDLAYYADEHITLSNFPQKQRQEITGSGFLSHIVFDDDDDGGGGDDDDKLILAVVFISIICLHSSSSSDEVICQTLSRFACLMKQ